MAVNGPGQVNSVIEGETVIVIWSEFKQSAKSAVTVYVVVPTGGTNATPSVTPLSQVIVAPSGLSAINVAVSPAQTSRSGPELTEGASGSDKVADSLFEIQPF